MNNIPKGLTAAGLTAAGLTAAVGPALSQPPLPGGLPPQGPARVNEPAEPPRPSAPAPAPDPLPPSTTRQSSNPVPNRFPGQAGSNSDRQGTPPVQPSHDDGEKPVLRPTRIPGREGPCGVIVACLKNMLKYQGYTDEQLLDESTKYDLIKFRGMSYVSLKPQYNPAPGKTLEQLKGSCPGDLCKRPEPNQPGTRPEPNQPGTRPEPNQPGTRPEPNQPGTRPGTNPGTRPGTNPGTRPGTNPRTRPGTNPGTRPETRPRPTWED